MSLNSKRMVHTSLMSSSSPPSITAMHNHHNNFRNNPYTAVIAASPTEKDASLMTTASQDRDSSSLLLTTNPDDSSQIVSLFATFDMESAAENLFAKEGTNGGDGEYVIDSQRATVLSPSTSQPLDGASSHQSPHLADKYMSSSTFNGGTSGVHLSVHHRRYFKGCVKALSQSCTLPSRKTVQRTIMSMSTAEPPYNTLASSTTTMPFGLHFSHTQDLPSLFGRSYSEASERFLYPQMSYNLSAASGPRAGNISMGGGNYYGPAGGSNSTSQNPLMFNFAAQESSGETPTTTTASNGGGEDHPHRAAATALLANKRNFAALKMTNSSTPERHTPVRHSRDNTLNVPMTMNQKEEHVKKMARPLQVDFSAGYAPAELLPPSQESNRSVPRCPNSPVLRKNGVIDQGPPAGMMIMPSGGAPPANSNVASTRSSGAGGPAGNCNLHWNMNSASPVDMANWHHPHKTIHQSNGANFTQLPPAAPYFTVFGVPPMAAYPYAQGPQPLGLGPNFLFTSVPQQQQHEYLPYGSLYPTPPGNGTYNTLASSPSPGEAPTGGRRHTPMQQPSPHASTAPEDTATKTGRQRSRQSWKAESAGGDASNGTSAAAAADEDYYSGSPEVNLRADHTQPIRGFVLVKGKISGRRYASSLEPGKIPTGRTVLVEGDRGEDVGTILRWISISEMIEDCLALRRIDAELTYITAQTLLSHRSKANSQGSGGGMADADGAAPHELKDHDEPRQSRTAHLEAYELDGHKPDDIGFKGEGGVNPPHAGGRHASAELKSGDAKPLAHPSVSHDTDEIQRKLHAIVLTYKSWPWLIREVTPEEQRRVNEVVRPAEQKAFDVIDNVVKRFLGRSGHVRVSKHANTKALLEEEEKSRKELSSEETSAPTMASRTLPATNAAALDIKVIDCEFQLNQQKLTCVVSRPSTEVFVDFRRIQRKLFRLFRCRIWMAYMDEVSDDADSPQQLQLLLARRERRYHNVLASDASRSEG